MKRSEEKKRGAHHLVANIAWSMESPAPGSGTISPVAASCLFAIRQASPVIIRLEIVSLCHCFPRLQFVIVDALDGVEDSEASCLHVVVCVLLSILAGRPECCPAVAALSCTRNRPKPLNPDSAGQNSG